MRLCSKCKTTPLSDGEGHLCSDCHRDLLERIYTNPDTDEQTKKDILAEIETLDRIENGEPIEALTVDELTLDQEDLFDWS
jgi:hypothetical protein